jgi:Ca2+-binding EF-hand superfamily protein
MFLRLFVNCRTVYGISKNHIVNALSILGSNNKEDEAKGVINPKISKDDLIGILTKEGEKMTLDEIKECEKILLGEGKELP